MSKRVAVKTIEAYMIKPESKIINFTFNDVATEIQIKPRLTTIDLIRFVDTVSEIVIDDGGYFPELLDSHFKIEILRNFTNINLPQDIDKQVNIVSNDVFMNDIIGAIGADYVEELFEYVNDKIEFKKKEYLGTHDSIAKLIAQFNHLSEVMSNIPIGENDADINDTSNSEIQSDKNTESSVSEVEPSEKVIPLITR